MATLRDHEQISRLLTGRPQTNLHLVIDRGWTDGDFGLHLLRHTPVFGLMMGWYYGPEGLLCHLAHVMADLSPLQIRDIMAHLGAFGRFTCSDKERDLTNTHRGGIFNVDT